MGGLIMKATDFLNDWWSGTHTSNPTIQDALDWAERKHVEEMRTLRQKYDTIDEIKRQMRIENACRMLEKIIDNNIDADLLDKFRKAMEESI